MARRLGLKAWIAAGVMVGGMAAPVFTNADDTKAAAKPGVEAKAAFARLKTLVGDWKAETSDDVAAALNGEKAEEHKKNVEEHKRDAAVTFKLTGADSALIETQFPGSSHEMVSVYHLDGDDLRMTHYCHAQNQPHVKLDRAASTPDQLIFVFDGGTNLDPAKDMHIHGLKIKFHEDGKVTSTWEGYVGGKKAMTTAFLMSRQTSTSPGHRKMPAKAPTTQ